MTRAKALVIPKQAGVGACILCTSACTMLGDAPHLRSLIIACRALLGQVWRSLGDPCVGSPSARRTFLAQASFALPVPGLPGRFLLMADRWDQERLGLSRRARGQAMPGQIISSCASKSMKCNVVLVRQLPTQVLCKASSVDLGGLTREAGQAYDILLDAR